MYRAKNTDYINKGNFDEAALSIFRQQYRENTIYQRFVDALHIYPEGINTPAAIPFLPISFFKTHQVISGNPTDDTVVFESSTTTGNIPSRHYVTDQQVYHQSLLRGFEKFYGNPKQYAILVLLPSYLERGNSSLVYMVKTLMDHSGHKANGFYLDEYKQLHSILKELENKGQPAILIGVTFALLDFAAQYPLKLQNTIVMETGGMKGRREELTREQVHDELKRSFGLQQVHSEYGMTELLSQAYSKGEGIFECIDSMQVLVRDINDPLEVKTTGTGALNIIDLANVNSCSFIATEDIGTVAQNGSFEVLGRLDNSALRGCNLMVI